MPMNKALLAVVQQIERDRGVSREIVMAAIEYALTQVARKSDKFTRDVRVIVDRNDLSLQIRDVLVCTDEDTGIGLIPIAKAMRLKKLEAKKNGVDKVEPVREGDTIEISLPPESLGRLGANISRQMIVQYIREAERNNTYNEFKDRVGEIVTGTVTGIGPRETSVTVGMVEMVLPNHENIARQNLQVGDTVRALITHVDSAMKGPSVRLSRKSPKFLEALFRLEVSEIAEGVVEIMGVSRDPGHRAKVAVRSLNENVDPVGACVGQRGSRVRPIVQELCGERIDIVRWNEDPRLYVKEALAPAQLESVEIPEDRPNVIIATVSPEEYSKALGVKGMNVRLATKLCGWHVEVRRSLTTASFEDRKAEAIRNLAEMFSITTRQATQIVNAGYLTIDDIVGDEEAGFIAATGLDEVAAKGVYAAARAVSDMVSGSADDDSAGVEE